MTAYGDMVENRTRYTKEEEHKNTQGECSYLIFSSLKTPYQGDPDMKCRYHGSVAERSASHVPSLYIGTETKIQTGLQACPPMHPRWGCTPTFVRKISSHRQADPPSPAGGLRMQPST